MYGDNPPVTFGDSPSVKNQRFLTPPLTQGRLWLRIPTPVTSVTGSE